MDERDIVPVRIPEDEGFEATLRPRCRDDFSGQDKLKENLKVFVEAAKARSEGLDHVLFYGPPGLG
ncbi:MAG: Holliday junction branch migration DNA helicase RuvB, partial [Deltaproteobacteria bacterium]|nr:Holliday junction branch migration DNA helicase RuvB [Deltaproteobacteria bacterium]